jgi:uncharacterized protein
MMYARAIGRRRTGKMVAGCHRLGKIAVARSFRDRFIGLMGRGDLENAFLWIPACRSIHTCFMKGPIDVAFLDDEQRVTRLRPRLAPWRFALGGASARSVLELPAGFIERHRVGIGEEFAWE